MAVPNDPKPIARAAIKLNKTERARIAKELGLTAEDVKSVPKKLEILRYAEADIARRSPTALASRTIQFGQIRGDILIPV
jgi:ABC-type metal ion transport system substrate-binding protein